MRYRPSGLITIRRVSRLGFKGSFDRFRDELAFGAGKCAFAGDAKPTGAGWKFSAAGPTRKGRMRRRICGASSEESSGEWMATRLVQFTAKFIARGAKEVRRKLG